MPSLAKIAASLYEMLHKDVKWIGSSKHTEAMHALQNTLSSPLVLCLCSFQKAFQLNTGFSNLEIGGVLL